MPKLKNNRHETFASLIAAGKSCAEAYISAGYEVKHPGSARACGSKLLRRAPPRIKHGLRVFTWFKSAVADHFIQKSNREMVYAPPESTRT
jgi:hypothetical protein